MIRINGMKLPLQYTEKDLVRAAEKALRRNHLPSVRILRRSLDSRKQDQIHYVISAGISGFSEQEEAQILKKVNRNNVMLTKERNYQFPFHFSKNDDGKKVDAESDRPVIVGTGPAGYFAGYLLASAGFRPILLERGKAVEGRTRDVNDFWNGKPLCPESNVSFGEGGAGTFSDGKLYTGNKDKDGANQFVLDTFHRFGAPKEITYDAKPHIGTDVLHDILKNLREDLLTAGGEIHFSHLVKEITKNNGIYTLIVQTPDGEYRLETRAVILAIGHSARDTFSMLLKQGISMEKKPFAMGLRSIQGK